MSYRFPPLVIRVSGVLAVAAVNTVVLAAPGANLRYRIVGCQLSVGRTSTGISEITLTNGVGGVALVSGMGLSVAGKPGVEPPIPEPGIPLSNNTALIANHISSVATGAMFAQVYYYIDKVT